MKRCTKNKHNPSYLLLPTVRAMIFWICAILYCKILYFFLFEEGILKTDEMIDKRKEKKRLLIINLWIQRDKKGLAR